MALFPLGDYHTITIHRPCISGSFCRWHIYHNFHFESNFTETYPQWRLLRFEDFDEMNDFVIHTYVFSFFQPSICKFNSTWLNIDYDVPCDLPEFFECVEGRQHHHGHHGWHSGERPDWHSGEHSGWHQGQRPSTTRPSGNHAGRPTDIRPWRPIGPASPFRNPPVAPLNNHPASPFGNFRGAAVFGPRPGPILDNHQGPSFGGSHPLPTNNHPGRHHHSGHQHHRPGVANCQLVSQEQNFVDSWWYVRKSQLSTTEEIFVFNHFDRFTSLPDCFILGSFVNFTTYRDIIA